MHHEVHRLIVLTLADCTFTLQALGTNEVTTHLHIRVLSQGECPLFVPFQRTCISIQVSISNDYIIKRYLIL